MTCISFCYFHVEKLKKTKKTATSDHLAGSYPINPTSSGLLTETKRISAKLVLLKVLVKSSTSVDFTLEWPAALQNFVCRARDAL